MMQPADKEIKNDVLALMRRLAADKKAARRELREKFAKDITLQQALIELDRLHAQSKP